jgi:hypothetical protein
MTNDRFIAHIHFDTRPATCFWLSSLEGDVTTDVTQAYEFTDVDMAFASANKAGQAEANRANSPYGVDMRMRFEPMQAMPMPKALQRSV